MASFELNDPNQVRSFHSGEVIRGSSKMLVCLHKILRIISSFPPPATPKEPSLSPNFEILKPNMISLRVEEDVALFDKDLYRPIVSPVSSPLETGKSEPPAEYAGASEFNDVADDVSQMNSAILCTDFSTAQKISLGESDQKEAENLFAGGEGAEIIVEKSVHVSAIAATEVWCSEMDSDRVSESVGKEEIRIEQVEEEKRKPKINSHNGSLDLLIEAAMFISGEFMESKPEPKQQSRSCEITMERTRSRRGTKNETPIDESAGRGPKRRKQNECLMVDLYGNFEDVSPVVRSTRGRSQVLPHKYRDSVLEPFKPLSRLRSAAVSTKRR